MGMTRLIPLLLLACSSEGVDVTVHNASGARRTFEVTVLSPINGDPTGGLVPLPRKELRGGQRTDFHIPPPSSGTQTRLELMVLNAPRAGLLRSQATLEGRSGECVFTYDEPAPEPIVTATCTPEE
jgi:hypothetical protein